MMTHTDSYAVLEISRWAFAEIAGKLRADYGHAFLQQDGQRTAINMHGIAVVECPRASAGESFGGGIYRLREKRGMTLEALAAASQIRRRRLRRIETGTESPTLEEMERMATVLGVTWHVSPNVREAGP